MGIHMFLYDVGGQHTCLLRRIPGFESRYRKYTVLFWFTDLFLKCISATGKHTLFTHIHRWKIESYGDIYLLLTHILIHTTPYYIEYNKQMFHPFICFTSIDITETGITTSHMSPLIEFTKTYGFKINWINNLSLSDYQSR